jgi:hypothetical protein
MDSQILSQISIERIGRVHPFIGLGLEGVFLPGRHSLRCPDSLQILAGSPGMQGGIAATKPLLLVDAALVPVRLYSLPGGFDQLPPLFHGRFLPEIAVAEAIQPPPGCEPPPTGRR